MEGPSPHECHRAAAGRDSLPPDGRAHVLLCWLALLLVRLAETTTGATWPVIRATLDRLHVITFTGPAGTFRQTTEPTKPQRDLLSALNLVPPKKILEVTAADPGPRDAPVT